MRRADWIPAVLCLVAAAVHCYVVPEHLHEYMPAGIFFIVVTLVQVGVGAALFARRPGRWAYRAAIGLFAGLLAVWALSRTVGMPMGDGWEIEPVGWLDLLSRVVELGAAAMAWQHLRVRAQVAAEQ